MKMYKGLKQKLMIALGWVFVILGVIGAVLPVMPTTVFMIIALWIFSKSSVRFHSMLLENQWFGPALKEWEENRTISKESKRKATVVIIISFGLSILVLQNRIGLQIMLFSLALILLLIIWKLKESEN